VSDLALRLIAALAARDAAALRSLFGSEVDFRGLSPSRVWEPCTPDVLIHDVILGAWFEAGDMIRRVDWVHESQVGSRVRIGYRLQVSNASGASPSSSRRSWTSPTARLPGCACSAPASSPVARHDLEGRHRAHRRRLRAGAGENFAGGACAGAQGSFHQACPGSGGVLPGEVHPAQRGGDETIVPVGHGDGQRGV
jgi:hypothetical protein